MSYGVPAGSAIDYGTAGFPPWVYELGDAFGLRASTYPGHQETDRIEDGYARNPGHLNRGIDWAGPLDAMQRFADYLFSIRSNLEQVIFENPISGRRTGVAGGRDVTNTPYFASDYSGHRDHVHTRQSEPIPMPGGAAPAPSEPSDTLFADVSEFQVPVDNSYPYRVLSIRSNDGTYRDHKFEHNYQWCVGAVDSGKLVFFIVYFYWHPNWQQAVQTHIDMVRALGGPHPKMVSMIDVERGGNPAGDFSDALNATDDALTNWLGDPRRVIAYANSGDFASMWANRREDQLIVAGYGANPSVPGKIAHQYTDGKGFGGGLPEGAPPFGNCDMNSADGLSPSAFAAACGIQSSTGDDDMTPDQEAKLDRCLFLAEQMAGVRRPSKSGFRWPGEGDVNTCAGFAWAADGNEHMDLTIKLADYGDPESLALIMAVSQDDDPDRVKDAALATRVLSKLKPTAAEKQAATDHVQAWLDAEKKAGA